MVIVSDKVSHRHQISDWVRVAQELGPRFAMEAARHDEADAFVAQNFSQLKSAGVFAAGIPRELGGGGASYAELCAMLRTLGRHCGSTALALSMHTHAVATMVWRWRRDPKPVQDLLHRLSKDQLVLAVSGASDWVNSSGTAERVEGGWRVNGRKSFVSGSPAGDLLITQAVSNDAEPVVLHFPVPLRSSGIEMQDTWRVLGMRGTGSNDIVLKDVFVPDSAISMRRSPGKWTPMFQLFACIIPLPLVYSVYLGIAEAARDAALGLAGKRIDDRGVGYLIGEIENELTVARLAHRDMVEAAGTCEEPALDITNRVIIGRTLVARSAARVVEKAMEAAGGRSFYRDVHLERRFRDIQAARFHRPQEQFQLEFSGDLALGRAVDA
jgi:alkylation response protein AidB-like acyl-CoA dehydrogenase